MAYEKTQWVNGQAPPINAENLNHIEDGIEEAHNGIDEINEALGTKNDEVSTIYEKLDAKLNKTDFDDMLIVSEEVVQTDSFPVSTSSGNRYYQTGQNIYRRQNAKLVGIVGYTVTSDNSSYIHVYRLDVDGRNYENGFGQGTLNWGIRITDTSKKWSGSLKVDILWKKTQ